MGSVNEKKLWVVPVFMGGVGVTHMILVSALSPNPSFFSFFKNLVGLGGLVDSGLTVDLSDEILNRDPVFNTYLKSFNKTS